VSSSSSASPSSYPGENLGLPREGYRSIARVGRRIVALIIDWGTAYLISLLWLGLPALTRPGAGQFAVLGIFVVLQMLTIPLLGGSLGHRLLGMAVTPIRGGWVGVWRPIIRSLLLGVVIPALVWDRDQRGFHDKIAGTVLVRTTR
jgi:hypothetical protein